jgi:phosphate transport system permease protein
MTGVVASRIDPTAEIPVVQPGFGPGDGEDRPRQLHQRTADDRLSMTGSIAGSFALVWVVYFQILPLSGVLGFLLCWYFAFLALYASVTAISNPRTVVVDRLMAAIVHVAALVVGFALVTVVVYTIWRGRLALPHLNFYTQDGSRVGLRSPLNRGGILHAIVGSSIQLGIAVVISLPLGLGTAVFMTEVGGWFSKVVRTIVEAMTAVPDLLAGLFVYVTLIIEFHMPRDGLAVAVALSVTMTPIIARSAEVALRVVPGGLREAGLALGASHWRTVRRIVLPTARPGLATALILAMARAVGESAPLLIVSGASTYFNKNPLKEPMNSLPLYIFEGAQSGQRLLVDRAFAAASVLLCFVFLLFVVTRLLARQRLAKR